MPLTCCLSVSRRTLLYSLCFFSFSLIVVYIRHSVMSRESIEKEKRRVKAANSSVAATRHHRGAGGEIFGRVCELSNRLSLA